MKPFRSIHCVLKVMSVGGLACLSVTHRLNWSATRSAVRETRVGARGALAPGVVHLRAQYYKVCAVNNNNLFFLVGGRVLSVQ
jgi:hypothetical protein